MGLDYSYMLYFKRDQLAEVLQGLSDIAVSEFPPTFILFPDHLLTVPLGKMPPFSEDDFYQYDAAEITFDTTLVFDMDEAILDWGHAQQVDDSYHSPIWIDYEYPVSIGYIYLTVFNDLSAYDPEITLDLEDLVLFNFGTTGTRMSTMFRYSTSIRKTLTALLKKFHGICGLFNDEEKGEVFWLNGKEMSEYFNDIWISPYEIEKQLSAR